jgi:hypothetical protein
LLSFSVFLVIALFFYLSRKSVALLVPRLRVILMMFCNHHITRTPRRDIIRTQRWSLLNHHRRRKTTSTPSLRDSRNLQIKLCWQKIFPRRKERETKKKRTVTALLQEEAQDEVCNHELNSYVHEQVFSIIASSRRRSGGHASRIARARESERERDIKNKDTPTWELKKRERKRRRRRRKTEEAQSEVKSSLARARAREIMVTS